MLSKGCDKRLAKGFFGDPVYFVAFDKEEWNDKKKCREKVKNGNIRKGVGDDRISYMNDQRGWEINQINREKWKKRQFLGEQEWTFFQKTFGCNKQVKASREQEAYDNQPEIYCQHGSQRFIP